jgi:outer membrane receptor protein involved in Fe transport
MLKKNSHLLKESALALMVLVTSGAAPCSLAQQQDPNQPKDLFNMSLEELMEIKVTAVSKRAESVFGTPGIVTVITKDEIRRFGAKNLLDVLDRLPSVYTTGSYMFGQNIASVRGDLATHHNNHTLVLINGRPVRESIQGGLNYPLFTAYPIEMIERIECVRGPGSVFYGTNAFTGIINIITKGGSKPELNLTAEGGSFGYYSSTIAGGNSSDDFDFFGALHQIHEDGAHWSAIDEAGVHGSLSSREEIASTAAHIESGPVTFDLFCTRQEANHFGRAPLWSLPGDEIDTKRVFADLGYNLPVNDTWRLEPHATFNYNRFVIESGALYHQSRDVLGEITLFGQPTNKLDIVAGYIIEHLATPQSRRSSIGKYSQVALSAYGEAGYQILENTRVITGGQWNEPEDGDGDFISRFGAIVDITPKWGMKLLCGEAFRAPWPGETLISNPVLVGNPNLKPEKVRTGDIQLFYHDRKGEFAATYFLSTMEEMIIRDTSVSPPSYRNGGEADFWGIELEGKRHLGAKLYALGSVTHQESKEDSGINPSSVPNTMGKLGLGYDNEDVSAGIFYTYYSTPPSMPGASEVNPDPGDVHWITANVNLDITNSLNLDKGTAVLTFRVENLLDQDVDQPEFNRRNINSLPVETGIAFYAGMRLSL